jgi:hypothetical protein
MSLVDRVTNRCDQRWADLTPRGEGRYCQKCDTTVVDLSRLTKKDATARSKDGGCFRMRLDEQGLPIFRPEPVRFGLKSMAIAATLVGCSAAPPESTHATAEVAGEPMAPVSISEPLVQPPPAEPTEVIVAPSAGGQPTAEQRALTARKHPPPVSHPPPYEMLGGMG